jgi:anthranilate synthase component 1
MRVPQVNGKSGDIVTFVPVAEQIPVPGSDPYTLFSALGIKKGYILESIEGVPRRAVRSIIGLEPDIVITLDGECAIEGKPDLCSFFSSPKGDDPVVQLRDLSGRIEFLGSCPSGFNGGFVGYCSYDMVSGMTQGLVKAGKADSPLARFMLSSRGIVYDHVMGTCTLFDNAILLPGKDREQEQKRARKRLHSLKKHIINADPESDCMRLPPAGHSVTWTTSVSADCYKEAVRRAQEYIRAGDIFQAVLSRRISGRYKGNPFGIYGAIRRINPSPYLYYLDFGDEAIIGSSPEMLVKVEGDMVQTVPIAGTRPRGKNAAEDDLLSRDLLSDPKEVAEHLMLVDLARNDIGRVASFGTVQVPEFMEIERFSHVQHIVSRVCGTLRKDCDRFDAFSACFPAGTVSGAPKIRAMQIISELESHPRGLYAGAVGYAGFDGTLEFAIAIRTLKVAGGRVEFSTGAGIVADSIPEKEFEETEFKAQAMKTAILQAGESG